VHVSLGSVGGGFKVSEVGMRISIRDVSTSTLETDEDSPYYTSDDVLHVEFTCSHDRAVVEPPCCNGMDCGCNGLRMVICDCGDLSPRDAEEILDRE
jgi:hypothetical protein